MGSTNGARAAAGALAVVCVLVGGSGSPADAQRARTPARHALTYEQAVDLLAARKDAAPSPRRGGFKRRAAPRGGKAQGRRAKAQGLSQE